MAAVLMWKLLWQAWDLRVVILLSLCLQILLIFLAPLRKRVSNAALRTPLWLAYLLADVTANFAVGLISRSQSDNLGPFADPSLLAFWAPFLLLHLGGPDTITDFALEDNELWLRHALGLGFQCFAVVYAFIQSLPDHKFWVPTLLMFAAGVIKYTERTRALYLASSRRFKTSLLTKPDPGPNYAKLMDEYTSKIEARLPTKIEMIPEPIRVIRVGKPEDLKDLTDLQVVQDAHRYFSTFKGLIGDLIFSFRERNQCREYFLKRNARDAFQVVEVELNFFYEILYTKATVVQSMLGYSLRMVSVSLNVAALVVFHFIENKAFEKFDIGISYTLLAGAIALDVIAFLMVLRSDWTAVGLTKSAPTNWFFDNLKKLLRVDRKRWPKSNTGKKPGWCSPVKKITQIVRRRWCESVSQYNLIDYCLHPRPIWWEVTIDLFGLTNILDGIRYVETVDFMETDDLRNLIFEELKMKSELADDLETAKEIFSARGDWILRFESCTNLLGWVNEVDFDESLVTWHIATELLYNTADEGKEHTNKESLPMGIDNQIMESPVASNLKGIDNQTKESHVGTNPKGIEKKDSRDLSKLLSDYMLYLLVIQATMLSTIAGIGQIRFRDTCAEAKKFFHGRKIGKSEEGMNCCQNIFLCKWFCSYETEKGDSENKTGSGFNNCCSEKKIVPDDLQERACKSILDVNTVVEPVAVKGDRSKSVLFDASMLAQELRKLGRESGEERMWTIISKVWVELLSYAAGHCRANIHVAQVSKGGELLTLAWLLMTHLGLGNQFQISEGHARAKLIVRK